MEQKRGGIYEWLRMGKENNEFRREVTRPTTQFHIRVVEM